MKKTVLIAFALVALAFASCKKDEVIEPEQTTDSRLYGDWIFVHIEFSNGNIATFMEDWNFTPDSVSTPYATLGYIANGSRMIIEQTDTLTYLISNQELNMIDEGGNNLVFTRK